MMTLTVDPPPGGTIELIRSILPALGAAERQVAEYFVDHPRDAALASVTEIAEHTGASRATVIRACQSLGFKGFQHIRLLLLRDAGTVTLEPPARSPETEQEHLTAAFEQAADGLRQSLGALNMAEYERAIVAIRGANRLLFSGNGGSGPTAQLAALHFTMGGRAAEAPSESIAQRLAARVMAERDVCVVLSQSGINSLSIAVAEAAREAGATVIGVTSYGRSRLAQLSDITLVVGAGMNIMDEGSVLGGLVQGLLLSSVQQAVLREDGRGASRAEAARNETLRVLDEGDRSTEDPPEFHHA